MYTKGAKGGCVFTNRLIAAALALSVLAAGLGEFKRQAVERALLKESVGRLERQRDLYRRYSDSITKQLTNREAAVTTSITRYRTRRDTLVITDTVQVKEVLATADTVIRSCQSLVLTCRAAMEIKNDLIANQDSTIRALIALQPSPTRNAVSTVVKVGLGVLIGLAIK